MKRQHAAWCAVLACAVAGSAHADRDKDRADTAFKQGKKLMSEKRYADACAAFEQSFKLDPEIGAELNIARCYEEWGKLARAYRAYAKAEQMAKDTKDKREAAIHKLVEGLDSSVPRLTVNPPKGGVPDGLLVTIDGATLDNRELGKEQLVDPGPHAVEYSIGSAKKTKVVPVERGGSSEIILDVPKEAAVAGATTAPPPPPAAPPEAPPDPGRNWRYGAYASAGAGVVLVGVSSYLALSARSKYHDALAADCGGMTNGCDPAGLSATHDARSEANVATILFGVGLAAIGGGVALYLLAPHGEAAEPAEKETALRVTPSLGWGQAGLVLSGRY